MDQILTNIAAASDVLVPALYTLLLAAVLDTATGMWAAFNSGTFSSQYLAEFVRSHVLQRIVPILTGLVAGIAVGGADSAAGVALLGTATAAGAAYLAETLASVAGNLVAGREHTKGLPSGAGPSTTLVTLDTTNDPVVE